MTRWTFGVLAALAVLAHPAAAQDSDFSGLEALIAEGELGKITAIEVDHRSATVYSNRFDGKTAETLTDIRSAGKSLTALAVGKAVDDGKLSVDDKVWPILGGTAGDPRNDITVRDLLTMSSALDCNDSDKRSPGQEEKMYRTRNWRAFAMNLPLDPEYVRDDKGYGRWSYCTAGVFLLGQVVQEVTGERFDEYVARHIFAPLGITDAEWKRSKSGEIQSGGQIRMRADDLAKIGRMVLDKGRYGGRQIVSAGWIEEMLYPHRQLGEYVR